ncbi:MAG: phosphotriesterase-related protein [Candidatus Binataceae bacterium]|jgi:phosphotriesterase-related protein|nr:phosphotriesterase-related protein [Candidatus Binataceae bacterium]
MKSVNTVTGSVSADKLGTTLMHEHLLIAWAGWELDCNAPRFDRKTALKTAVERLKELKDLGLGTFVDPCPNDIGRDIVFMADVAAASGVNVVAATGLYKEDLGNTAYFRQRTIEEIADVYVTEITKGVGETGIKAGIIKCATGKDHITEYENRCLRAAARASKRTGVPITTHTEEGTMGREQLDIFAEEGVDLAHVVIGHSCGASDLRYHTDMLDRGCLLGFDRFGLDFVHPDRLRLAALIGLVGIGFEKQLVLSHDSVACWKGKGLPEMDAKTLEGIKNWNPTHIFKHIIPALKEAGVGEHKIKAMMVENPRRFFET